MLEILNKNEQTGKNNSQKKDKGLKTFKKIFAVPIVRNKST